VDVPMNFQELNPEILQEFKDYDDHEHVRRFILDDGIIAFIAVHNTNLGPALGGCRMRAYESEMDAINDVIRLSKGMTYKNAMAGLPLGGGKAVIIGDPATQKTTKLMQSLGRAVQTFEGAYVTAEDSGTAEEDMVAISSETEFVVGLPPEALQGSDYGELGGNPSPLTALGCYHGIKATVDFRYEFDRPLKGMTIGVQGVGAVGFEICRLLQQDGVNLIVTDVNPDSLDRIKEAIPSVQVVASDEIYSVEADIFVPCAMGGILNDETIPQLKAGVVAGMANNQLQSRHHDKMLMDRDILYVPDYVINSGGVICVGYEFFRKSGYNPQDFDMTRDAMVLHVEGVGKTVTHILEEARKRNLPTGEAANLLAEEKFLKGEALDEVNQEESANFAVGGGTKLVQ
jgi:leucine dehydrogenase